jgi:hypothetical protein
LRAESRANQFTRPPAEQLNFIMPNFVRVIVDRSIRRELDYAVPEPLREKVIVGSRVRVPFRQKIPPRHRRRHA